MKTKTYNVYKFDELPKDSQHKALDNYRYINVEHDFWCEQDGLLDLSQKEMDNIKVKLSKKWYNSKKPKDHNGNIVGEYPAYTGLITYKIQAFDVVGCGNYIQFSNITIMNDDIFRRFLHISKKTWKKISYRFVNERENNTEIYFTEDNNDLTDKEITETEKAAAIFNNKVREALEILRKDYEYLTSDEAITETLKANDYDFTLDGKIDL